MSAPARRSPRSSAGLTSCGARFAPLPIERLRAFDPQVAAMFEWFDRRTADQPDLPRLRALHPGLLTLAAWVRDADPNLRQR
jgi:hypothetical protein